MAKKTYVEVARLVVNVDIVYLIDSNEEVVGKIDLTMKKICGKIFKDCKYQQHFN